MRDLSCLTRKSPKQSDSAGQRGQIRGKRSDYAIRLEEKQKLRLNYGISERQLVNHDLVTVKGRVVNTTSHQCKADDAVGIYERMQSKKLAQANLEFSGLANLAPHLELD